MNFDKGYLYHVYNQGNNKQKIFYNRDNYFFFLEKINHYIKPYVDILAWCLMPNHFHLMMLVKEIELVNTHRMTQSHPVSNQSVNQEFLFLIIFLFLISIIAVVKDLFDVKVK